MLHDPRQLLLAVARSRIPDLALFSELALSVLHNIPNIVCSRSDHLHEVAALRRVLLFLHNLLTISCNLVFGSGYLPPLFSQFRIFNHIQVAFLAGYDDLLLALLFHHL